MKFVVERDALKDALAVVVQRTKGNTIPILSHVLIEGQGQSIRLTGHDLDSCGQVSIAAEVTTQGSVAIPGDYFARLVAGFPDGSTVLLDADEKSAKVKCGRSSYQFQLMSPEDFPSPLEPKDPVAFTLTTKQIARLFKTPETSTGNEQSRIYLAGIYLHKVKDRVAACATNGHTLLLVYVDADVPTFEGIIVPSKSCHEIVRIVGASPDAKIEVSKNLIAVEASGRRFVSKVIDGTFPDYMRVIPQATASAIALMTADFDAALARLVAACDREKTPVTKLQWNGNVENISASLRSDVGAGEEQIECDCPGRDPGETGAQIDYLRNVIGALGGSRVRMFIDDPGSPIRFENPDDPDLVGVVMPCRV